MSSEVCLQMSKKIQEKQTLRAAAQQCARPFECLKQKQFIS